MHRTGLLICLLALAFFGLADSWYLAESAANERPLSCSIVALDGCNTVAQSPYSHLFGVPLGAYGVLFYALLFVLAAAGLTLKVRHVPYLLLIVTILGAGASVIFVAIQFFLIKALCVYCLVSAGATFAALAAAGALRKGELTPPVSVIH